ncbi:MAG: hypothetical protein IPN32_37160 [Deltaproteobacteria bacterium]|nr:hypothetical protein [Deltaproteobacteria bacterium]
MRKTSASLLLLALTIACGDRGTAGSDGDDASGPATETATEASASGDDGPSSGTDGTADSTGGDTTGDAPPDTDLPPLPELTGVQLRIVGDAANIVFDPWEGAVDYRVYPLPADDDITVGDDGSVIVEDAIYRCAGHREGLYMLEDVVSPDEGWNDNAAGGATILARDVLGYTRAEADAVLGYVYTTAGEGRIPVYVLGDPDPGGEGGPSCGRPVFQASRPKLYTTDAALRDQRIAQHWRDDGIAFWVPASAGAGTKPVFEGNFGDGVTLRWVDGPEAQTRGAGETVFEILSAPEDGAIELYRVHVAPYCSRSHDELVAGSTRFARARSEGDQPLTAVRWSGLTASTTLVVEALDHGCPYLGNLSPQHQDPFVEEFGEEVLEYEGYQTPDDMRALSPTGELFVNGQSDDGVVPRAVARSFVTAAPELPTMDFYASFPESEDFYASFGASTGNVYAQYFEAPGYHLSSYANSNIHFGTMFGELWFAYNDIAADVNGKVRLTPSQTAQVGAEGFLHVQTEVDIISTDRRYPQIIISDRIAPVQDDLASGTTMIVQPKDMTPTQLQVQICDHRTWDVNDQCPRLPTFVDDWAPNSPLPGERTGSDNAVTIDVYLSSTRLYLLLDGQQYACTDLPATSFEDGATYAPPVGEVTVTWGDVLYHSGVDFAAGGGAIAGNTYLFHRTHLQKTTRRHFDNLGFSSGVAAPAWNEALTPCSGAGA